MIAGAAKKKSQISYDGLEQHNCYVHLIDYAKSIEDLIYEGYPFDFEIVVSEQFKEVSFEN